MNKFKIKSIKFRGQARQLYFSSSSLLGAHTCWSNEFQFSGFRSPERNDYYTIYWQSISSSIWVAHKLINHFTETNSHHPYCPIIKIFHIYALYNKYFLISFLCTKIINFHAKMTCIYVLMQNFVHTNYLFRMNAQICAKLVSYWYKNDAKVRAKQVISSKTTQLLHKKINCFVETLIIRL